MNSAVRLPIHGFVLAGGKSSRMGRDKATITLLRQRMVDIAIKKLEACCSAVSIAGNRPDLVAAAPIVTENRLEVGPIAGIEAGLCAALYPWAMFIPVDVPLVPDTLLGAWAERIVRQSTGSKVRLSFLRANGVKQPTFCLLHKECLPTLTRVVDEGERKLGAIYQRVAFDLGGNALCPVDAETLLSGDRHEAAIWFSNVNTPEDMRALEQMDKQAQVGLSVSGSRPYA